MSVVCSTIIFTQWRNRASIYTKVYCVRFFSYVPHCNLLAKNHTFQGFNLSHFYQTFLGSFGAQCNKIKCERYNSRWTFSMSGKANICASFCICGLNVWQIFMPTCPPAFWNEIVKVNSHVCVMERGFFAQSIAGSQDISKGLMAIQLFTFSLCWQAIYTTYGFGRISIAFLLFLFS